MVYLTKELFVIPNGEGESFILYAPLKRAVAKVNGDTINLLRRLKAWEDIGNLEEKLGQLKQIGIVTDRETPVTEYVPKKDYTPTSVTLVPTLDCNLRCVYCYSTAGENVGKIMDIEVAKSAIDFVIGNAKVTGKEQVGLVFHGGGEPFLGKNMGMVKEAVEYFKDQTSLYGLKPDIAATTNGVMSSKTLEWVASNFNNLNISFDGPEDIQNKQRPTSAGMGSFAQVMETIKYLESIKFDYHIRATITKQSVSRMPEILEFFSSISSLDSFALEPLFECGRCKTSKAEAPSIDDYIKYLIKSRELAKKFGRNVNYSGSIIEGIYDYFCSSLDVGFFCVLPDGNATSCLEVCRDSDPRSSIFMTGKYSVDNKKFTFDMDKIQNLRSRNVDNIPHCKDCFAKYNCAGDCPSKCYTQSGSLFDTSTNSRCEITREAIKNALLTKLKGDKKE